MHTPRVRLASATENTMNCWVTYLPETKTPIESGINFWHHREITQQNCIAFVTVVVVVVAVFVVKKLWYTWSDANVFFSFHSNFEFRLLVFWPSAFFRFFSTFLWDTKILMDAKWTGAIGKTVGTLTAKKYYIFYFFRLAQFSFALTHHCNHAYMQTGRRTLQSNKKFSIRQLYKFGHFQRQRTHTRKLNLLFRKKSISSSLIYQTEEFKDSLQAEESGWLDEMKEMKFHKQVI